jgi:hypothetical protein
MTKNTGGPAFPVPSELCQDLTVYEQRGLTMRDYFAAKAMQGFASTLIDTALPIRFEVLAQDAYAMADAMLKAREQ